MTIACTDCGTLQDLPALQPGDAAVCPRCASWLERTRGRSVTAALACALTTGLLLIPANLLPLMSVSMAGVTHESRIGSAVATLWHNQWIAIALGVGLFVIVLPFVRFALLSLVLSAVSLSRYPRWLGRAFRWALMLDPWAMPDVYLIGLAIGYSRLAAHLTVRIESGGYCAIAAALLCMLSRASLDRRTVWRAIAPERCPAPEEQTLGCTACDLVLPLNASGSACPRCARSVTPRKPDSLMRTVALLVAALLLYFPANIYPMSIATQLGSEVPHRIIDGIRELFEAGLWPLGVLIFITSITIPLLKIGGLGWLVLSIRCRSRQHLLLKSRCYRLVEEIGRWSNIDVFTIAVFVPLIQFGALASARAAWGAPPFMLVVVLTMVAARVFDARLLWDTEATA